MTSSSSSGHLLPTSLSREHELLMNWPFNLETYNPSLTFGKDALTKIHEFENTHLSRSTAVHCLRYSIDHFLHEEMLSDDLLKKSLKVSGEDVHKIFFIKRFVMNSNTESRPKDIKRLRISKIAFRHLLSHYEIPHKFVTSMLSTNLASLSFNYRELTVQKRPIRDFFYILPVRVAVACGEVERSHVLSSAGSNQMDPSHYLHLTDVHRDIRPSKIAIYLQHDESSHQTTTICVDFQDGRVEFSDLADEPLLRTREVLQKAHREKKYADPFFIHLVLLTSVVEWWRMNNESVY